MRRVFKDKTTLANCKIYQMLKTSAGKKHLSFHTPGHKQKGWDITELSYSDNLCAPKGCILEAERDIAQILNADRSFILTDGSTAGVLAMLYAVKSFGGRCVAFCEDAHKSVFNGCALLGLTPLVFPQKTRENIPLPYTIYELKEDFSELLTRADALLFTSPNYYGEVVELKGFREYCNQTGKLLLIDGAHGGHLHFDKTRHAGGVADMWVDGVHKSLPAFTQGAVVSARTPKYTEALKKGVDIFRTTSPSYPIMASVEYAVKYPKNDRIEREVRAYAKAEARAKVNEDWTKLLCRFGANAFNAEKYLESKGIFAEFCDGEYICFYLSPATSVREFRQLQKRLKEAFAKYPYAPNQEFERIPAPLISKNCGVEKVDLEESVGRVCAEACGLFPPCTPLFRAGERIDSEGVRRLLGADNVYGVEQGKISVYIEKEEEKEDGKR